jgi:hypothetical protein
MMWKKKKPPTPVNPYLATYTLDDLNPYYGSLHGIRFEDDQRHVVFSCHISELGVSKEKRPLFGEALEEDGLLVYVTCRFAHEFKFMGDRFAGNASDSLHYTRSENTGYKVYIQAHGLLPLEQSELLREWKALFPDRALKHFYIALDDARYDVVCEDILVLAAPASRIDEADPRYRAADYFQMPLIEQQIQALREEGENHCDMGEGVLIYVEAETTPEASSVQRANFRSLLVETGPTQQVAQEKAEAQIASKQASAPPGVRLYGFPFFWYPPRDPPGSP